MMNKGLLGINEDPITLGLLQAAAALATPQRQGGGYGAAMMAFPQALQQAGAAKRQRESDEMQRELFGLKRSESQLGQQKSEMELRSMREELARQQRIRERLMGGMGGMGGQVAPGGAYPAGNVPIPAGMSFREAGRADMAPAVQAAAAAAGGSPRMAQFQRAMSMADVYESEGDFAQAAKIRGDAVKLMPEVNKIDTVMVRDKPTQRIYFKDGTYQDITDAEPAVDLAFQNGVGVNRFTGKPVAAVPDVNQPFIPQLGPDGRISGVANPQVQSYQLNRAKAGAPSVNVTGERAFEKEVGEYFAKQYGDIQTAGFGAQGKLNRLDRLGQLLDGLQTGKLTPAATEFKATLASLGINIGDPAQLGTAQAVEALANEMALQLRNPSGGAGMPGALSDKDREFLQKMVVGLGRTPEGNRILLESQKRLAKRDQDIARLARDYRKRTGKLDEGFYDDLQTWSAANPLFDDINDGAGQPQPAAPGSRAPFRTPQGPASGTGLTLQEMAAQELRNRAAARQPGF